MAGEEAGGERPTVSQGDPAPVGKTLRPSLPFPFPSSNPESRQKPVFLIRPKSQQSRPRITPPKLAPTPVCPQRRWTRSLRSQMLVPRCLIRHLGDDRAG
ncbi:hypothetical protein SKAU_G00365100 [Synaphobranchus kaupii]|uniref:Uncharacterized protein n=1 Tax=Synaphobranchus kaupii TaxID=118154 RepID=A0A9Q1IFB4_SYNKA|nr:hypothetical protein SKAU_G00365100 [Synaphobranchus kaupii]